EAEHALLALESEGVVLRGRFTPGRAGGHELEWCDRRLLARIHRYTLTRLRAEIEPVSPADFMRFLFAWQHAAPSTRLTGLDGLRAVVGMLDGFELAANAWEAAVLPSRIDAYDPSMLDTLCLTGEVGWGRVSNAMDSGSAARLVGATPIALFLRQPFSAWHMLGLGDGKDPAALEASVSVDARRALEALRSRGALFLHELADRAVDLKAGSDAALAAVSELVAAGLATSDGFGGLRTLVRGPTDRPPARSGHGSPAGRWSAIACDMSTSAREAAIEAQAWSLLRRYGVVFRRALVREANAAPWRELIRVYRRLEARGDIRGGRFVSGMSGEQFALPEAVERVREIRRTPSDGRLVAVSGADPLNLAG